jgi:hypothetical protein
LLLVVGLVLGAVLVLVGPSLLAPSRPGPVATPVTPVRADVAVTVSEDFLNRRLKELSKEQKLPAGSEMAVDLRPDNLAAFTVGLKATAGPFALNPQGTVVSQISAVNGRISLALVRVEVGGVAVPAELLPPEVSSALKQAEGQINAALSSTASGEVLRIVDVRTTADEITVKLQGR